MMMDDGHNYHHVFQASTALKTLKHAVCYKESESKVRTKALVKKRTILSSNALLLMWMGIGLVMCTFPVRISD